MIWEKDGSSFEIRTQGQLPDGRPALDEVVATGASVHLEQMAHDHWWMGHRKWWEVLPFELWSPRWFACGSVWQTKSQSHERLRVMRTLNGKATTGRGRYHQRPPIRSNRHQKEASLPCRIVSVVHITPVCLAAFYFWPLAALTAAHRFFVAAMIAALPALLSFLFAFGASGGDVAAGSDSPRSFAHRAFCARAIFRRAAAENFFRLRTGASGLTEVSAGPPDSMARSSAI
jgi:hypothetical protein